MPHYPGPDHPVVTAVTSSTPSGEAVAAPVDMGGWEPAQAILAVAARAGVEHLWFVSGNDLVSFQEAAARAREGGLPAPRIMQMVHEHVALSIAMGEAAIRRAPAAVAAHVDVGLLHMGGALHNAMVGQYPILTITGYPGTHPDRRTIPVFWKQQRWDQGAIVRQFMKWDYKLATYDDPALVTARALQVALTPPHGPCYLILPKEVGHQALPDGVPLTTVEALGVPRLGAGPEDALAEVAQRLLEAEKPLLITDRLGRDHRAVQALDVLAREFALAVRATRHRMNLPDDHPAGWAGGTHTSAGAARNDGIVKLEEADAILVLEHSVPWIPARERPASGAWISSAGTDPAALFIPLHEFPAHLRIVADPAAFLEALLERMRSFQSASHRERIDRRWRSFEEAVPERTGGRGHRAARGIDARLLGRAVAQILEPEDVLTWEMTETRDIPRTRPDTLFESGGSSLGWSVAAGIGIRLADPGRFVASLVGDGAYQFGSPSILLWAQARYEVPLLTVIANNRGYRTGTVRLREDYPDGAAVRLGDYSGGTFDPPPDFAAQAEAAGGFGARVMERGRLVDTLRRARRAVVREGRPAVVDVRLPPLVPSPGDTPPRGGTRRRGS